MFCFHWQSKVLKILRQSKNFTCEYSCYKCGKILKFKPQIIVTGLTLAKNNEVIYPQNLMDIKLQ